jgi:hypothetical protein
MLHPFGAVVMRSFSAAGLCIIVAGCSSGTSERLAYQESPDARMTRIALAGRQDCEAKFPTAPRRNNVAQARCIVAFNEQVIMPQDDYPDLVGKLNATRLVVAERLDKGAMSEAEATQQMADAKSAVISEALRRRANGAQTQAQIASAQAAQSQAMTAAMSTPNPFAVPAANPCPVLVGGRCR